MLPLFKTLASVALRNPAIASFVRRRRHVDLVSLCFHRFGCAGGTIPGHDLVALDESLRWLKRAGFVFAELEIVVHSLLTGRQIDRPTVVVSIDDGYEDLKDALPVFFRHRCPVSVFLATGFLDSRTPLWWDQIHLLLSSAPGIVQIENVAGISWKREWKTAEQCYLAGEELIEIIKRAREPARLEVIRALAQHIGTDVHLRELRAFAPLKWNDVRALEREGVRFGPHTHTHPILSALNDTDASYEIEHSWDRLRAEVARPLPIFAYPNGTSWSFSDRDVAMLRRAGMIAAVTTDSTWRLSQDRPVDMFRLGRFVSPANLPSLQASVLRIGGVK